MAGKGRTLAGLLCGMALGLAAGAVDWRAVELPLPGGQRDAQRVESRSAIPHLELLTRLGYVDGTVDPEGGEGGVLHHLRGRAATGLNFYSSRKRPGAWLLDMEGRVVHHWPGSGSGWAHAELLRDGSVLAIQKEKRVFKVDADGRELWSHAGRVHHDLWVHPNGEIYVLTRGLERRPGVHPEAELLLDRVTVLSSAGELLRRIDLYEAVRESEFAWLLPDLLAYPASAPLDVLHTNHVEGVTAAYARAHPFYREGDLLLSFRNLNAIALLDAGTSRLRWVWGPNNLTFQHHPTLLESGRILVFDNGLERSRVLEIEPPTGVVRWRYEPEAGFFTRTRGSNQRLWNGNTLLTESDRGHVREVDPDGNLVWHFANPHLDDEGRRMAIWRMTRFRPERLAFLEERTAAR